MALSLFVVTFRRRDLPRPGGGFLLAAGLHVVASSWMLHYGLRRFPPPAVNEGAPAPA